MTSEPAIEASGLEKSYGTLRVLDGVDLEVRAGSVFALLGPNGAGKTTAVRILATLARADAGRARVAGFDVVADRRQVRRRISLTGQFAAVDDLQTGEENLRMMGRLAGLPGHQARRRAAELLERFDLAEAGRRTVATWSAGMRRRLDLAASLVREPAVLFLDEPTTGLDPRSRQAVWQVVADLVGSGVTVFLTTQYLEEADVLADRVGIIDHGRIVAEGTPDALKAEIGRPTVEAVPADPADRDRAEAVLRRFGEDCSPGPKAIAVRLRGAADLADVVRALDEEGIRVEHLQLHQPSLDDVFLAKTGRSLEGAGAEEESSDDPAARG
ncbi:MAG: ATP-binding cassette domain-containing protein, partial [Actinomycetes bacterium]